MSEHSLNRKCNIPATNSLIMNMNISVKLCNMNRLLQKSVNQWLTQLVQKRICTVPKICISALKNRDLHCWSRCNCKYIFGFCARYTYVHKSHTYICTLHASAPRVRLVIRRWDSDFIGTVCIKSSMSKFHQYIYKYITLSQYKRTSWQSYHFEIHMYNIFHPQSKNPAGCCLKMH